MFQIKAKLIYNKKVKENYWRCSFASVQIASWAQPGQFVQIKLTETCQPLLRRPFSIHRLGYRVAGIGYRAQIENREPNTIEILYEVIGKGTEILANKNAGEYLDVIGPLGNGFNYESSVASSATKTLADKHRSPILVAGGMGVAPLLFLAEKLMSPKPQTPNPKPLVLIGAKTKAQVLCEKEFKDLGCVVKISTDDGSKGFKGKITDLLKSLLSTIDYRLSTMYACGPRLMLREISCISQPYNIPAQISLEEHMACGIGACLGCVIKVKNNFEYKRICKEGPVFNADEIVW